MNKRGFTLIELLAVIVILVIITLIAVPIITNVIEYAKQGAAKSSVLGYLDAVENQMIMNQLTGTSIDNGGYSIDDFNVTMKGNKPTNGKIIIKDSIVDKAFVCYDGYSIEYDNNKTYISNNDYCNKALTSSITLNIGTEVIKEDIGYKSFKSIIKDLSSYQSISCNNGVTVSYNDGVLNLDDVYTDTTCTAYDSTITALNNLDNSENYLIVLKDEEVNENLLLKDKILTLDLNGHKITSNSDEYNLMNTRKNSNLTIKNGTLEILQYHPFDIKGIVNLYNVFINVSGTIWVREYGTLNIYEGTVIKNINVVNNKTISLYSGDTNIGGTVNMYGGKIESNKRSIVNEHNGTVNIYDGEVVTNEGQAISNVKHGSINIYGGKFENKGLSASTVIMNSGTGTVNITNGTFNSNGDITLYNKKGTMNINGGSFTSIKHATVVNDEGIVNINEEPNFVAPYTNLVTYSGVINVNGGIYKSINNGAFIKTKIWDVYSGGIINICKAKTNSPIISNESSDNYIYYASDDIDWNGNSDPTLVGSSQSNIIMDTDKACQNNTKKQ